MHIVNAVMVIAVTFFAISMFVTMFVIVIIRPFDEQRFHPIQLGDGDLFLLRNALR